MIGVLILSAWIGGFVLDVADKKRSERFDRLCIANSRKLLSGEACEFEGKIYTADTELISYNWCAYIFVMTFMRGTSFYRGEERWMLAVVTLITLFGGWWGIPWGPVRTIQAFVENAKNMSEPITMRNILTR